MRSRGKSIQAVLVLAAMFLMTAGTDTLAADKNDLRPWQGEIPVRGSWLREHLPEDALMYFRMPHPLGFLAAPKGNIMDNALRSTANIEALQSIQGALVSNVLEHVPGFEEEFVRDFADKLRSPIEVAVMLAPAPSMILSMNLDVDSDPDLQQMIEAFQAGGLPLSLLEPLDSDGFGQIVGLPVPTAVNFDAETGQLILQSGPAVAADQFFLMVESLAPVTSHKMHAMEQQIDSSGYGLFMWIDSESALPAAQMFLNPEQLAGIAESGLDKVRAAAFGWGAANGKGRMSVILDMPRDGDRQFLPYVNNELTATSVGEPDAIFTLSIPTAEEFSRIEALVLETASEESRSSWIEGKAEVEAETGITIENVLGAIGPELIGIFDEAGDYAAIRLRDEKLFNQFVEQVSAVAGSAPSERRYKRKTFYHWSFSREIESLDEAEAEALGPLAFILGRQGEHIHWYQDGDFLYIASLPQPLIDRIEAGADTDIDAWLSDQQNMDLSGSALGLTGSSEKLPRRIYYVYIELLQAIADISEAEFDVWSMPTAAQAGLPDKGALGFSLNLGDPYLSMELMFENNPLESIFSGDMTSVAAIGILAAIAIPAYQDYTIRAQVNSGLNDAGGAKAAVAEYYFDSGEYPGPTAAAAISEQIALGEYTDSISIVPGSGIIVITYTDETQPGGGQVFLEPSDDMGNIVWTCSGSIPDKHLPAACRGNPPPELESGGT